jgi:hypothetical protein
MLKKHLAQSDERADRKKYKNYIVLVLDVKRDENR